LVETKHDTAQTRDGVSLRYALRGDGAADRPRIVLIHSLGLDESVWSAVADRLAQRATVLTYDARGHGASSKRPGPYLLERFAEDLVELLDRLGWETAIVAGCSMGGNVALRFATSFPRRTAALGLVDTTAWYGADAPLKWDERAQQAEQNGLASMIAFQQTRWFSDEFRAAHPDVVERYQRLFVQNDVPSYAATCRMLGSFDLRSELGALTMPTVIVVGEEDYATPPAMSEALHQSIAGSTLRIIPRARHLTPIQVPDAIADALETLLQPASAA